MAVTQFQDIPGSKVAYDALGEGPPLFLLHGGEGDRTMFKSVMPHLSKHFRVINYDQRDCGQTTSTDTEQYELAQLADDAAALIAALGYKKAHVLGHSAGGLLAQKLACRHPHCIDRLVLEATLPMELTRKMLTGGIRKEVDGWDSQGPEAFAVKFSTPEYVKAHPEIAEEIQAIRRSQVPELMARRMAALALIGDGDLKDVQLKTLVLAGARDILAPPAEMKKMADSMPNARFQIYPEAGHIGIMMFPEGFTEVIADFLKSN